MLEDKYLTEAETRIVLRIKFWHIQPIRTRQHVYTSKNKQCNLDWIINMAIPLCDGSNRAIELHELNSKFHFKLPKRIFVENVKLPPEQIHNIIRFEYWPHVRP